MAILQKRRGRKPLETGKTSVHWSNFAEGERFNISVGSLPVHLLSLTRIETEQLVKDLQARLTDPELLKAAELEPENIRSTIGPNFYND